MEPQPSEPPTKSLAAATLAAPGTPEAAHAALDGALRPGLVAALPVEVNLTTLTDALRERGIVIASGRHGRPAHYGRPAAAERVRHGAPPFGEGSRVRLTTPYGGHAVGEEGEVVRVFQRGDGQLCAVEWDDRSVSNHDVERLVELAVTPRCDREPGERGGRPRYEAVAAAVRKEVGEAAYRLSPAEVLEADAELDRVAIPRTDSAGIVGLTLPERVKMLVERALRAQEVGRNPRIGELRIVLEPVPGTEEMRFVELEDGEGNSVGLPVVRSERDPFSEIVIPAPEGPAIEFVDNPPEPPGFDALWSVVKDWDVKRPSDDGYQGANGDHVRELLEVLAPVQAGVTEATGQRIAKALETLTTSAGGALRELLDRGATE